MHADLGREQHNVLHDKLQLSFGAVTGVIKVEKTIRLRVNLV